MISFPKRANFECYSGDEFPDKSIQTFGHNFEAKGNFTFSWEQAVHNSDINYLCSPYYLIIKEFTRRVQYNAIPFYVNQTNSSKYDLSQIEASGMYVEKVIDKMFGTELVKSVIERSIANNEIDISSGLMKLALMAPELRSMLKTHCILSSRYTNRLLKGNDNNLYIGREHYFESILNIFYGKDLDPILFNAMEKLFYDINESVLREKWFNEAIDFTWNVFDQRQDVIIINKVFEFTLSNFKIASGPLFLGQILSVLVLILERNFQDIYNYI